MAGAGGAGGSCAIVGSADVDAESAGAPKRGNGSDEDLGEEIYDEEEEEEE